MPQKPILPEGPRDARIAIVGEAPGASEEIYLRPFCGASGNLLTEMLRESGIDRAKCYITNVVKLRPLGNNFGVFYTNKTRKVPLNSLLRAHEELREELLKVKPNVIIALGEEALYALTGKREISKWRGSVLSSPVGKVLPTFHPAYVLRMYSERAVVQLDLAKALKESSFPEVRTPNVSFEISPSFSQVMNFLSMPWKRLAVDIETSGRHVSCLALSGAPASAICIPFMKNPSYVKQAGGTFLNMSGASRNYWSEEEELEILRSLDKLLGNPSIEKVLQNFPFDATILAQEFGLHLKGLWMDTMVAQHCCYSELLKGLDFLTSIYTDYPYYSDYNRADDISLWTYNCWDACVTLEISSVLEKEMKELKVWEFYRTLAQPAMIALARISNRGITIDVEMRDKLREQTKQELEEIKKKISALVGTSLDPGSPKQLKELLYDKLKLPLQLHHKTHQPTTDEKALEKLRAKAPEHQELFDSILSFREKSKLLDTFLASTLRDGKMFTSFNATGTKTGRISSSKTIFGEGGNLQQIPRGEFRRMYVASEGKVLIKADLSQAEARAVAWAARDRALIEKFLTPNFDIHKWNASLLLDIPLESVTKEQRNLKAKPCQHALNYRGSPFTLAKLMKIPQAEAKLAFERWRKLSHQTVLWQQEIEKELLATRKLYNPLGRLRIFMDRLSDETFRSATGQIPQSLVADVINLAVVELEETLPPGCFTLLQVHDEVVVEAWDTPECIEMCVKAIKRAMEKPVLFKDLPGLSIPSEISFGKNWFDQKKVSNG
jgi:uracil-DNA glycosylase family 4